MSVPASPVSKLDFRLGARADLAGPPDGLAFRTVRRTELDAALLALARERGVRIEEGERVRGIETGWTGVAVVRRRMDDEQQPSEATRRLAQTPTRRSGARRTPHERSHLRTSRGDHEVDLIVQPRVTPGVLAIEVKLASTIDDTDVRHLTWLQRRVSDELIDTIVITTGPAAYRRTDGIGVVPAALLGP